jgi:hypothetical protein
MITAQAREIERDPNAAMLPLAMDAALIRFRRVVANAIAEDRPATSGNEIRR